MGTSVLGNSGMGNRVGSARRSMAFIGSNPGLALHPVDRDGQHIPGEPASCFASFWMADWSRWGIGNALLIATRHGWRSYGTDEVLAATPGTTAEPPTSAPPPVTAAR